MLECIEHVLEYCREGEASFRESRLIQDAVLRKLQILAESSQRLSDGCKGRAVEIPWRAMSGFRNVIVHDYFGVDLDAIWRLISTQLGPLKISLENLRSVVEAKP